MTKFEEFLKECKGFLALKLGWMYQWLILVFVSELFIIMYSPPPPQNSRPPYQLAPIQSRFPRPGPKPVFARNEMDYSSSDPSSGFETWLNEYPRFKTCSQTRFSDAKLMIFKQIEGTNLKQEKTCVSVYCACVEISTPQ